MCQHISQPLFPTPWSLLGKQEQGQTHQGRAASPQLGGCCDSEGRVILVVLFVLGQRELSVGDTVCSWPPVWFLDWFYLPQPRAGIVMECDWGGCSRGQPWWCMGSEFWQKSPVLLPPLHVWAAPGTNSPAACGLPLLCFLGLVWSWTTAYSWVLWCAGILTSLVGTEWLCRHSKCALWAEEVPGWPSGFMRTWSHPRKHLRLAFLFAMVCFCVPALMTVSWAPLCSQSFCWVSTWNSDFCIRWTARKAGEGSWKDIKPQGMLVTFFQPHSTVALSCAACCPEMLVSTSLGWGQFSGRGRKEFFEESGWRADQLSPYHSLF